MLQLSIVCLFASNLFEIFGFLYGEKTLHVQQNGFGVDEKQGNWRKPGIDRASEKVVLETLHTDDKAERPGKTLEECYGGTCRWLSRNFSIKNSMKKQICYCRCCVKTTKHGAPQTKDLAGKESYERVKAGCFHVGAFVGSVNEAVTMDNNVSVLRSSNTPTKATGFLIATNQYTVSDKVQHPDGLAKKTYRSKKSDGRPKISTNSSSKCICHRCLKKACLLSCEILKPFCFCCALPCLCLEACCLRSSRPCDDCLKSIYSSLKN